MHRPSPFQEPVNDWATDGRLNFGKVAGAGSGAAWRQRRHAEGDHGTGDAALAGHKPSYSRPRVSDDNAYAESLFRTAKYRPEFPAKGFANLDEARTWAGQFTHWYNVEHRHSGIGYVTPAQRHVGDDHDVLAARHALYTQARAANPRRWSGATRDWTPRGAVTLNPERDSVIDAAIAGKYQNKEVA